MGCCLIAALVVGAPRLGLLVWWFADPLRFSMAFPSWSISPSLPVAGWVVPVLGFLFLPWTTVAYLFVWPGGLSGLDWVILVLALLIDLSAHGGGGAAYKRRRSE